MPALGPDVGIVHAQRADRRRQRAALGDPRRAEGDGARVGALDRDGRGDRRRARAAAGRDRAARAGSSTRSRVAPGGAQPSYAHGYYERDNDFYVRVGRDQPRPRHVHANGCSSTCSDGTSAGVTAYTADEMMAVEASRRLDERQRLLRRDRAAEPSPRTSRGARTRPDCVLVYESGTIGAKPTRLPLSIGDGELAETADAVVSVPEMFAYWLQGGRIDVGFLGAAQIDRHGNLNSTVIGDYDTPKVRLPGGGGAPEIATSVENVFVMLRQTPRAFVEQLDFMTSRRRPRARRRHRPRHPRAARRRADARRSVHPGVGGRRRARRDRLGAARRRRRRARPRRRPTDELAALRALERARHDGDRVADRPARRPELRAGGAARLPGLPLDAAARAEAAARHAAGGAARARRARSSARTRSSELDDDLTRQHEGEPLGERIVVSGRVLRRRRAADPRRARRGVAGERRRPLPPRGRPASGAARPELLRRRPLPHRRRRQLPLRHGQARRVPVGQPRERVAAGAHPLLDLRARASRSGWSRRCTSPATRCSPYDPIFNAVRDPKARGAARRAVRPRDDRRPSGRSASAGTSCSRGDARWRRRDAAAHAVADGRPVLRDRPVPPAGERARAAGIPASCG